MVRIVCASLLLVLAGSAASADVSPIKERKAIFKKFADMTRPLAAMVKNRQAFDPELVQEALETYATGTKKLLNLFPDTSKSGDETEARATIWEDKAKYDALLKRFDEEAMSAQTKIVDEASFRATMPKLLGACKDCHDGYRDGK